MDLTYFGNLKIGTKFRPRPGHRLWKKIGPSTARWSRSIYRSPVPWLSIDIVYVDAGTIVDTAVTCETTLEEARRMQVGPDGALVAPKKASVSCP